MAWPGMTSYDVSEPRQRMGLYRTVLHEGLRDDLPRYLNQDLLLQLWPVLRALVGPVLPWLTRRSEAWARRKPASSQVFRVARLDRSNVRIR